MNKNRAGCQTAPCFLLHLKLFTLHLPAGHHGCFSSPVPRSLGFSSLFPSWRGTMAAFLLLCPASSVFLLSSPPGGAPRLLFFSCAPLPRFFFSLHLPAGHHGCFSSPVPRFLGFFFSLYRMIRIRSPALISFPGIPLASRRAATGT